VQETQSTTEERRARARCALDGLSVGDAFGECFFVFPATVAELVAARALPDPPWPFTDDTQMALSLVAGLARDDVIDQDRLVGSFAEHYDPERGYGPAMEGVLSRIGHGESWRVVAPSLFGGRGSYGNGAAMRVDPLGAYYADDLDTAVAQAIRSAEVTHAHPEGIAGAVAVAAAAAWAWRLPDAARPPGDFLDLVLPLVPAGAVHTGIQHARELPATTPIQRVASVLGNGSDTAAHDTVPFALWCAARHLDDFETALWTTVSGLGDRDTTCAIVGGIVASHTGPTGIPAEWLRRREPLPAWAL
jgi:ADP-ribosylglycohydrolase